MAFTLISVGWLDNAKCFATFSGGMCTIHNPSSCTMAIIPCTNGLYHVTVPEEPPTINYVSIAMVKLTISEAHWKLSHIAPSAIKYAITKGHITGIQLDPESKPEFCKACAKAKATHQPFPKESETCTTKYGECIHWDLWGLASVQSLSRNSYMAAHIDDATHKTMLYFQAKKSQTIDSYKCDEALIEMQTGNRIKVACSNQGGEYLSDDLTQHQDMRGTKCKLTVHDSPQQNSVAECRMHTSPVTHLRATAILVGRGNEAPDMASKSHSCLCHQQKNTIQNATQKETPPGRHPGIQSHNICQGPQSWKARCTHQGWTIHRLQFRV